MRWPWSKNPEPELDQEIEDIEAGKPPGDGPPPVTPVGFMAKGQPNKVTPQKHKPFPNRMNRNKRMP